MLLALAALLVGTVLASAAVAQPLRSESDYQQILCAGMELEVTLPNGARIDCLSPTHAIEVEFSEKWAEALGQALLYAASSGKQPGIILICHQAPALCLQHGLRLEEAITFWKLPVIVWRYEAQDAAAPR
jgi:hypothetical protein